MQPATRRQFVGVGVLGGVVVAAAVLLSPAAAARALESLAARPRYFGVALLVAYLLRPLVAWPISLFSVTLGYLYGPRAFPVALAGAVVTCLPPYLLARTARGDGLLGRAGDSGRRYFDAAGDLRGLTAARLFPLPADPVSYGAGLAGLRPGAYVLGTALGEAPWTAVAVLLGSSMGRLAVEGVSAGLPLVAALTALGVLVLAGPVYRHWRGGISVTD